jgi:DNA replication protein DnaC
MLTHPTHDRLIALGLTGMAKALEEQRRQPDIAALAFEERIAMMIDREAIDRENKRLTTRLKFACLRQSAIVEDVDMKAPRGLDKALFQKLIAGDWINRHQNLIVIGPTGIGKSWLACALGHPAETIAPSSISACRGCSMPWRWHAATAAMPGCSRLSHASNS